MQKNEKQVTYENPSVEIVAFSSLEVIVTSGNDGEWDFEG